MCVIVSNFLSRAISIMIVSHRGFFIFWSNSSPGNKKKVLYPGKVSAVEKKQCAVQKSAQNEQCSLLL